jgi:hypothetical protein
MSERVMVDKQTPEGVKAIKSTRIWDGGEKHLSGSGKSFKGKVCIASFCSYFTDICLDKLAQALAC